MPLFSKYKPGVRDLVIAHKFFVESLKFQKKSHHEFSLKEFKGFIALLTLKLTGYLCIIRKL